MKLSLSRALAGELDPELNRAMVEAVGWTNHIVWGFYNRITGNYTSHLPDFLDSVSSLGHCAAAEAGLTDKEHQEYRNLVFRQCEPTTNSMGGKHHEHNDWHERNYLSASCRRRVIAYLRVKSPEIWES